MLRRNVVKVLFLVLVPALLTLGMFQPAVAGYITYSEAFPDNVDPFPGATYYPEWTYASSHPTVLKSNVAGNVLHVYTTSSTSTNETGGAYVTATSAFGVADFGTDLIVSSDIGTVRTLGAAGNLNVGLRIEKLWATYIPPYAVCRYYSVPTDTTVTYLNPPGTVTMSFVPSEGLLAQHMIMRAVKNGSNWDVTVTITEGANTWSETRSWADSIVTGGTGAITKAGVHVQHGSAKLDNSFDNFQVEMYVPEPSSIALLTCGLLGLLAYAWRKRK